MGCFNKIGFISSLPIFSGDETTLIFMIPNKYYSDKHGGVCYSTDLYEPIFLPIFGEYDDYGRIEYVKMTDSVKFIQNFFGIDINTDKMISWNEGGYYDKVLNDLKSDDRDDKIVQLLQHD